MSSVILLYSVRLLVQWILTLTRNGYGKPLNPAFYHKSGYQAQLDEELRNPKGLARGRSIRTSSFI